MADRPSRTSSAPAPGPASGPLTGPQAPPEPDAVLRLARDDKRAAESAVAALSLDEQVGLVCSTPLGRRADMLELTPMPEDVIPLLPEAELTYTAKAVGLADAGWILEHASAEQLVASLDLDGWQGLVPDTASMGSWLLAFADAGEATLLRAARSVDPELIVTLLRERAWVDLDPKEEGWQPPNNSRTLEGQFHLTPKRVDDDLEDLMLLLDALFREDYWLYFRMLQGAMWELGSDLQEWALRWRTGRLEDLGFPSWDEAMRIYGYLRESERSAVPEQSDALDVGEWQLPVFMPSLPGAEAGGPGVFRVAAELESEERRGFFYAFVSLANKVAVADRMPLGEPDTLPEAIQKAAAFVTEACEHLSGKKGIAEVEILRRVPLERLFRIGVNLGGHQPPHVFYTEDDLEDEVEPIDPDEIE